MSPLTRFTKSVPTYPKNISTRLRLILLLLVCVVCELHASAQDLDEVTISGRVTDQTGAVVRGATLTAAPASGKPARTTSTDDEGRYLLVELEPGAYALRASSKGFAAEERTNLLTVAGQNVRIDFTLRPAGVAAETTILSDASAQVIDTTRTVVGGTLTRAEIEILPAPSRSPLELVFTLGGVTDEPLSTRGAAEDRDPRSGGAARNSQTPEEAGVFALSGGPAYSNNITLDGLDNNDDRAARERFQPSLEAVEEVQVITNQFSAEYGRASGGRVNLRTRGGSKNLRGRLFHFFEDEALNANTFNNNRRGLKRLPLQRHASGMTLSGPLPLPNFGERGRALARGRTFFFLAYEYQTTLDSANVDARVPVEQNPLYLLPAPMTLSGRRLEPSATAPNQPAELAPFVERVGTPARQHTLTARVDHNFTDTHNATLLYQLGRAKNLRQFGGGLRLAESLQGTRRDTDALSYTDNYVFSARLVNQLRAQLSRLVPSFKARGAAARPVVLIDIEDPLGGARSGTLVAGASSSAAADRRETRWQIQNTLTAVARGAHTLKFGGDVQRVESVFADLSDATGTFNFASAGDFLANAPDRFRQRFGTESAQRNTYAGVFAHDEWRARENLTVSFGLRYENETILRDRDNWAPRLAAAYSPGAKGTTVLRLGAGLFYNRALLRTIDDFALGKQIVEFDTHNLPAAERRPFIAAHIAFPQTLSINSPLVRQHGARLTNFSRRLDKGLRIPESYQFNVGVEREAARRLVVEANYTFNRGIRLWREFNINAPRLPRGYADFAAYLLSRDFPNFRDPSGARAVYNSSAAGEFVRFTDSPLSPSDPNAVGRVVEFGVPVSVFNLNNVNSTAALEAALAALAPLRPDPARGQIEQLVSAGNSFYHGLTVEARRRFAQIEGGFAFSFRAAYTLSRLTDDGVVNTSSAINPGDFRAERARSLLDRRHRFALSGVFDAPRAPHFLRGLRLAPVLRLASGAPFNLTVGGADRNLDDVSNDRPTFNGDLKLLRARRPGEPLDPRLLAALSLPIIGRAGNLPRNAGRGPALFVFDLSLTREFRLSGDKRLRPTVEFDNVLNKTVHTFGAEFINFNALRADATPEQRQAFADTFLVPTRTLRPREIKLGLRLDF